MKATPEGSNKVNDGQKTNSLSSFGELPSLKSSKEDMVFDYFDSSDSSHKTKSPTRFEMTTFNGPDQLSARRGRKYDDVLSEKTEESRAGENGARDVDSEGVRNGPAVEENLSRSSTAASHHVRSYDDRLRRAVVEDSPRKFVTSRRDLSSRSSRRLATDAGETVAFFPKESSNRADGLGELHSRSIQNFNISSTEGEELLQVDGSLKVQTTLNSPFMSTTVSSNCLTNLICSIKPNGHPNDRTEVNKRMQRRDIKKKHLMRKACEYRSEDIPEYMGKLPLDEIMAFIDDKKGHRISAQPLKSLKKDDTKANKVKVLDDVNGSLNGQVEQGGCSSNRNVADLILKKSHEFDDTPATNVMDMVSLATSSSTSSFRTASPPADIPQSNLDLEKPEIELTHLHSPSTQKEFITVQKKKKLKQSTPVKSDLIFETTPFANAPELCNSVMEQQIKLAGKPSTFNGRQANFRTNLKVGFSGQSPKNNLICESLPLNPDDINNNVLVKNFFSRTPFADKKEIPTKIEDSIQKPESQFDPSHFPELTSSGRRNSTGSSGPKNLEESSKGFAFSYADIAAKLRQKKHSSDMQRRNSLQLTCQEVCGPAMDSSDPFQDLEPRQIKEITLHFVNSSQNSVPCAEFDNISAVEDPAGDSSRLSMDFFQIPLDKCKRSNFCKEPVVFLDGRKNPKVTDLVFIFDPTIPSGRSKKFDPPEVEEFEVKESCEVTKEQTNAEVRSASPQNSCDGSRLRFRAESDSAEDSSPRRFSPGFVCVARPDGRPSPLSDRRPTGRRVVKVSPMPVVTPSVRVDGLQKNVETESKPSSRRIESSFSSPAAADPSTSHKNSFDERFTSSVQRNLFDLCKAQMFLYAGFEECLKESKNNPTNVVVYSE